MKHFFTSLFSFFAFLSVNGQIVNIPDLEFKTALLSANSSNFFALDFSDNYVAIDLNNDAEIQLSEALLIKVLSIPDGTISDLTGIASFSNLEELYAESNDITTLDVTSLTGIKKLWCRNNELTSINTEGLNNLIEYFCDSNNLSSLNIIHLTNLEILSCSENLLTSLTVTNLTHLKYLYCDNNQLTVIDLSTLLNLELFYCNDNLFTKLDVTSNVNLINFLCHNNFISSLNVSTLFNLVGLNCSTNFISSLNLNGLNNLAYLNCYGNELTNLNISGLVNLLYLYCAKNQIPFLDLTGLGYKIQYLDCSNNPLGVLSVNTLHYLIELKSNNCQLTSLYLRNQSIEANCFGFPPDYCPVLEFSDNPNLTFVCVDNAQLADVQNRVTQYGYTNCVVSSSVCIFLENEEFNNNQLISIYPNPANELLTIDNNSGSEISSISILNTLGQIIKVRTNNLTIQSVNVSNLESGIYFIKIVTENKIITKNFMKI
jgi:hypothetical protein